jgi:hypothetical protein
MVVLVCLLLQELPSEVKKHSILKRKKHLK